VRDEDFAYFVSKFGEATHRTDVPQAAIDSWRGRLPDRLLTYWGEEGWCAFANGLLWLVDPDEYEDVVDEWLSDSVFEQIDAFHVIARTASGKLFLWGETTGQSVTINCATNAIFALKRELRKKAPFDLDISMRSFLGKSKSECDLKDEAGAPLFDRAEQKLGILAADEMYGFEAAIVLGGKLLLDNVRKVKTDQHLTILRQLATPTIPFSGADIEKLLP
jgi:hypothetical protein